ncbi:B12-binding domain-containing radical SAM protein [Kitasatospora phosalacinea]|uniref:B12-binding domain-containing radical SAM protein n=1 Tax=Kitasatospora phosalacinea TaxID=2065 RepID=UPI00365630AE
MLNLLIPADRLFGNPRISLRVWLADLTYTQQSISSEIMPQAVGGLATYAATKMDFEHPVRIFKYPEQLARALAEDEAPDVMGFSNYIWNSRLSLGFAERIKEVFPEVVTVFGGPHYPVAEAEQASFLRERLGACVDFYVDREGEQPFAELLLALHAAGGSAAGLHGKIPGLHSIDSDGRPHLPPPGPRLPSLSEVPSPYVAGLMDEFFDGKLIPTVQTNRGCPFSCSFCVEGTRYYSKVAKTPSERTREELLYIGKVMEQVIKQEGVRNELLITDSNFGMFPEDLDVCDTIVECQDTFGWPRYVDLTTGKNKRDRVLDAISRTRGTMTLSGSVQSLDPEVLSKVRRNNISASQLMEVALAAAEQQTGTYSEVILGLPGDSKQAHFSTLSQLIDAGFDRLNMFQLALLPGSDMWTGDQREQHGMVTRFRVIPRCYGSYSVLGATVATAEIDEVCVTLPSMPFADYLDCRQMNLFVSACHNDGTFASLARLLKQQDIPVFRWLERMQALPFGDRLRRVVDEFRSETGEQLWESREELTRFALENVDQYISGELGNNLLYTYRVRMLTEALDDLVAVAVEAAVQLCAEADVEGPEVVNGFIREAAEFHRLTMTDLLTPEAGATRLQTASFDIEGFLASPDEVAKFKLPESRLREFSLTSEQVSLIEGYLSQFGAGAWGAGRMLTKVRFADLLRRTVLVPEAGHRASS